MLHVACIYEMLTGDGRYSDAKTNQLIAVGPDGREYATNTVDLALHLAACMRINATGGVPCEPVQKRHFLRHFILKMHHFTKTGSGQT